MIGRYQNASEIVGNTPLLELNRYSEKYGMKAHLLAKLEYFNPTGSIKDRAALYMIEEAEKQGKLAPGAVIIEPTSGNTGIGLAAIAASKGYQTIFTMPATMSMERRKLLLGYGAELVLTPGSQGMPGAIKKAEELVKEREDSYMPGQFSNPANPKAHQATTGPEIWRDTEGAVDVLVAAVGTGGTITGLGEYLRGKNPALKIIAVEPAGSPVLSGGAPGAHKIQGIGAGFIPKILNRELLDEIIMVEDRDAFDTVKEVARTEGIFVGISSGAALWAAKKAGLREDCKGKNIVVIFPDGGDRYLSTEM